MTTRWRISGWALGRAKKVMIDKENTTIVSGHGWLEVGMVEKHAGVKDFRKQVLGY